MLSIFFPDAPLSDLQLFVTGGGFVELCNYGDFLQIPLVKWRELEPSFQSATPTERWEKRGEDIIHKIMANDIWQNANLPSRLSYIQKIEQYKTVLPPLTELPDPMANLVFPNYRGVVNALSLGGSHADLFLKASKSEAPALLQGSLPTALLHGNLPTIKATLEAIINQMPLVERFTKKEIQSLQELFTDYKIPLLISSRLDLTGKVESVVISINK